jgi:hypothetical protein
VYETIEYGIGQRWAGEVLVPVLDGQLAGDEGGSAAVAVFKDLEQVAAFGIRERSEAPVIEDEQLRLRELRQQLGVGAVSACERQITEQPAHPEVPGGQAAPAGGLSECTREVCLAAAGGSDVRSWCHTAQAMRASSFASATAALLVCISPARCSAQT